MAETRAEPSATAHRVRADARPGGALGTSRIKRVRTSPVVWLHYAAVPALILVTWHVVSTSGIVRAQLLPSPIQILLTLWDLVTGTSGEAGRYSGAWWQHVSASATRVFAGFAIAVVLGVVLGVLIGLSRTAERLLDPTIQVLRNIPITAWVPLSIVFFGISDRPAVFLIALGAIFPTVVNTTHGVKQVNRIMVKAGLMLGATRWQLVRRVILPAALPSIFTGARLSMGIAWVLVVVAEMIAVKSGVGYLLFDSYQFFRPDVMIACMLTVGLLGFVSDRVILAVRSRTLGWNQLESLGG